MWPSAEAALLLLSSLLPFHPLSTPPVEVGKAYLAPSIRDGFAPHALERARELVKQMTLEEKVNITSAALGPCQGQTGSVPRLGVPGLCFQDGPAGPRYTDFVTQFPSEHTSVASFDRQLIADRARAIGKEFRGKGINVELGPVIGGPLGRTPYGGRNWEAWTPDPYLAGEMTYLTVKEMQSSGLITCVKHFLAYEQQMICDEIKPDGGGGGCDHVSAEVDDKTLHELYLPAFSEAIRAGTGSVMCSYNRLNGTWACENDGSIGRILKEELNFQGFVVSDFDAVHSTIPTANHGMDVELPFQIYYGKELVKAVKTGDVPESRLDDMAHRILATYFASGQAEDYPAVNYQYFDLADEIEIEGIKMRNEHVSVKEDHYLLARKVAAESTVLLKNNGILPFKERNITSIGVFGSDADYPPTATGCGPDLFCNVEPYTRYWNGTVTSGGGSGATYADYIAAPIEAISLRTRRTGTRVDQVLQDASSYHRTIEHVAAQSDVCLVFVSLFLVEGFDRPNLKLDKDGEALIRTVERSCQGETVVVMHTGGPVVVEDWIDLPGIAGVLWAGYPGQETGNALVEILWGETNPSGKMPYTTAKKESHYVQDNIVRDKPKSGYPKWESKERTAVDYRWFDLQGHEPRWEFGFGLSYTDFEFSGIKIEELRAKDTKSIQVTNEKVEGEAGLYDLVCVPDRHFNNFNPQNDTLAHYVKRVMLIKQYIVTVEVENTGAVAGAEVAQLYITFPDGEEQPPKQLKGFDKAFLAPLQSATVSFPLRKRDLAVWDVEKQLWRVPDGEFTLRVGSSSRDLPLEKTLKIKGGL